MISSYFYFSFYFHFSLFELYLDFISSTSFLSVFFIFIIYYFLIYSYLCAFDKLDKYLLLISPVTVIYCLQPLPHLGLVGEVERRDEISS